MNQDVRTQLTAKDHMSRLTELTGTIGKCISEHIDRDNPDEVSGKLMELTALQSSATYAYALAEQLYNEKLASLVESNEYSKLTATDKKMIFAGKAKTEIYYLTMNERLIRNLSHSIEALRSILSWKKSELENARYQTT